MIRTFLKIALRNFIKEKFFSLINVLGLSVGISVSLLIVLYLIHEFSYDRFHEKHERIYRLSMYLEVGGNATELNSTFPPMAAALMQEMPEVENATRVDLANGKIFKVDEKVFTEDNVLYADASFLKIFDFKLLAGNPSTAISKPNQILLTPALSEKYFGVERPEEVVGRAIHVNRELYEVSGIIAEPPSHSHIQYTAVASIESTPQGRDVNWDNLNVSSYLLLKPGASIETVVEKIPAVMKNHIQGYAEFPSRGILMEPRVMAIADIHLHSHINGEFEPGGSMLNVYIFGSVAFIVLLLASVNFVNLLTARSANRAKEVGVRKVLGSARGALMRQFIVECILLVAISTLLSLGIIELLRVPFTALTGKPLPFDLLLTPMNLAILLLAVVGLGIVAGAYPAFFLSSFQPAQILKGKISAGFKGGTLRNSLVTLQFVISMILITCTLVVQHQLNYMRSKKLGFDKENILVIDNADRLSHQRSFIQEIEEIASVESAGASTFRPVDDYDGMLVTAAEGDEDRKLVNFSRVDPQYMNVLKYEFVAGRNFSSDIASDSSAVVINERAAELLFNGDAIGKKVFNDIGYTVIGVVKDFNFESLKNEIRPLVFYPGFSQRFLHVRILPGDYSRTISSIETIWKRHISDVPFSYSFLDETYDRLYQEEVKLGTIFSIFTALGLFIACLGLMGLTAYMAEQRKKEISVRKVLGASPAQVIVMLSRDFGRIMLTAFVLSTPLAWYIMEKWLENFVFRTDVSWFVLALGGIAVLLTSGVAISYQAIRAALVNPVESLKEE